MQIINMDGNESKSSYWRIREVSSQPCNYNLEQLVEDLSEISDNNEYGFFIECNLENPIES